MGARAAEPLGEDQPQPARRRHPARSLRRAGEDAGPGRRLPLRPTPVLRAYAPRHDGDQPPGYTAEPRRASRGRPGGTRSPKQVRSEEHTSELQSLMRNSYAVFCLKKKKNTQKSTTITHRNQTD